MGILVKNNIKVITDKIRMDYVNLFVPRAMTEGEEPKYSLCIIIPKSDKRTVEHIYEAIEAAKKKGLALWGGKLPEDLKLPIRDGDLERKDLEEYEGKFFINASSKYRPGVVDKDLKEIVHEAEVYPGCFGRVSINFYPYSSSGSKGIGCGLLNVQKVSDGKPIGFYSSPEEDFAAFKEEEDILW